IVSVALAAFVLSWVVRRSLAPVDELTRQIGALDAEDLGTRINVALLPGELAPVVDRLNELLGRLAATLMRERRFTGDVAHELRTPLAGLRMKLEVAVGRERSAEALHETVAACLEICLHMQRMVENLLHLVRADAGQLETGQDRVNLDELVRARWAPLEGRAVQRNLHVTWSLHSTRPVESDEELVALVIHNVLENAVAHTETGGEVHIATAAEDGAVRLAVRNTGCRIPPGEVDRVFERFWRADASSRPGDAMHCGLGLPLARTVLEQVGGRIDAACTRNGEFTVTVTLPAVQAGRVQR
ncbi:MAG TPA: ATP-binding protein, partial [Phycisphaerae bacterium]|nr:ATP-binding protein [Phycisphaerae bacterium]